MSNKQNIALVASAVTAVVLIGVLGFVALGKLERMTQIAERTEQRLNTLADTVEPVMAAGGSKAVEAIANIDAEEAADKGDEVIGEAAERAKRFFRKDQDD